MYTDSLPIVLCTVTRHNNAKIARFFMYLSSLLWLEISFAPGKSHLINIADYFSRKNSDGKLFSIKLPTKCDQERCELLNKKLKTDRSFTAAKTCYVIDSLSRQIEATLLDIKIGSYGISDHGDISWISNSTGKKVLGTRKISSKTSDLPLKALEKQSVDALNVRMVINDDEEENGVDDERQDLDYTTEEEDQEQQSENLTTSSLVKPTLRLQYNDEATKIWDMKYKKIS